MAESEPERQPSLDEERNEVAVIDRDYKILDRSAVSTDSSDASTAPTQDIEGKGKPALEKGGLWQALFEKSSDAIAIIQDGRLKFVNQRLADLTGFSIDELQGRAFKDVVSLEFKDTLIERSKKRLDREEVLETYELEVISSDGRGICVEANSAIVNFEGKLAILAVIKDLKGEEADSTRELTSGADGGDKYLELFDRAPDIYYLLDREGVIAECNHTMTVMLGYPKEELIGRPLTAFFTEESKRLFEEGFPSLNLERDHLRVERVFVRKDGTAFPADLHIYSELDGDGKLQMTRTIARDITESKRAQESLVFTQFSVDRAGDAIFWIDKEGRFTKVNDMACRSLGYTREELLRMRVADIDPNFQAQAWASHWEEVKEKGSFTIETVHRSKDGKTIPVEVTVNYFEFGGEGYNCAFARDVSKRKKAEEELEAREGFLAGVFESIQDGLCVLSTEMDIIRVNSAMERWYSHAMPLVGRKCYEAFHNRTEPCESCPTLQVFETGKTASEEVPKIGPTGERVGSLEHYSFSMFDKKTGKLTGAIEYARDITERRNIEEVLDESQRTLSTLMSNLPGMAYRCRNDPSRTMEVVSKGALQLTGYTPFDLINNKKIAYAELIHPYDVGRVWKVVQEAVDEKRPFQQVYRIITSDGREKWVWEQGQGIYNSEGDLIALEGLITDITRQKETEEGLRRSQGFLNSIIENSGDAIIATDKEGLVTLWSKGAEQLVGYTSEEALKRNISFIYPVREKETGQKWLKTVLKGETTRDLTVKIQTSQGDLIDINLTLSPLLGESGTPVGAVGVSRDVSAVTKAQKRLEEKVVELEEWHRLTVDRELKMIALEKELGILRKKLEKGEHNG